MEGTGKEDKISIRLSREQISVAITILFSFLIFVRNIGGVFDIVNIAVPMGLLAALAIIPSLFISISSLKTRAYYLVILVFIMFLLFGTIYSNAPAYGREKVFTLLLYVCLGIIAARHVVDNIDIFLKANLVFFIIFILAYLSFFRSFQNILTTLDVSQRDEMGGEMFNVIGASRYIGFSLISAFFMVANLGIRTHLKGLILLSLLLIGLAMMLLFGTKGPLVSLLLAPVLFFLFHYRLSLKKMAILTLFGLSVIIYFLHPGVILDMVPYQYRTYFEYRFFRVDRFQADRFTHFYMISDDIEPGSLAFGKGTGNFGFLRFGRDARYYPHNIFAEFFYENGIFGLLFFFTILIMPFVNRQKTGSVTGTDTFYVIAIYYFLINAQVSTDFARNAYLFVFLMFMAQNNFNLSITKPEKSAI